jgi:hypothetical protein
MKSSNLKEAKSIKLFLAYDQSIRVAVIAVIFTFSITLLAYQNGNNHMTTTLRTQTPGNGAGNTMRKLLSVPSASSNESKVNVMMPVKNPAVIEAEIFLRKSINVKRQSTCASFKSYNSPGYVQFAKMSTGKRGAVKYSLEVVYGNETVFARIASKEAAKNKFELVSCIPSPCDGGLEGRPAVSFAGVLLNISVRLMDSDT